MNIQFSPVSPGIVSYTLMEHGNLIAMGQLTDESSVTSSSTEFLERFERIAVENNKLLHTYRGSTLLERYL